MLVSGFDTSIGNRSNPFSDRLSNAAIQHAVKEIRDVIDLVFDEHGDYHPKIMVMCFAQACVDGLGSFEDIVPW